MRWLWLLVALCGCRREPTAMRDDPAPVKKKTRSILERYPVRGHFFSVATEELDGKITKTKHEETCTRDGDDPPSWMCHGRDLDGDKFESRTHYRLTDQGLVYYRYIHDGKTNEIVPPKLEVPRDPRVGRKWSGHHVTGMKKTERSCEILALDSCADGITVSCVTKEESGRVIEVRNKYCGGIGYVGGDGLVRFIDGRVLKSIDEDVRDAE